MLIWIGLIVAGIAALILCYMMLDSILMMLRDLKGDKYALLPLIVFGCMALIGVIAILYNMGYR